MRLQELVPELESTMREISDWSRYVSSLREQEAKKLPIYTQIFATEAPSLCQPCKTRLVEAATRP